MPDQDALGQIDTGSDQTVLISLHVSRHRTAIVWQATSAPGVVVCGTSCPRRASGHINVAPFAFGQVSNAGGLAQLGERLVCNQ